MRTVDEGGRWAPVYDAEDLKSYIRKLAQRDDIGAVFYESSPLGYPCQGDIVQLSAGIPLLDKAGVPRVDFKSLGLWMVVGNTCDFDRTLTNAPWTQMVPVVDLLEGPRPTNETSLRAYETTRSFYLPAWSQEGGDHLYVADLTRPVQVHKGVFDAGVAKTLATMKYPAWILLNACLVRFLARDDGRFDP